MPLCPYVHRGKFFSNLLLTPFVLVLAASPFLAMQVVFDLGATGHPFRTPYAYYLEQDQPGSAFGFHAYNPAVEPKSSLPEKREFYDKWVRERIAAHTPAAALRQWTSTNLAFIVDTTLPCRMFLLFVPLALVGLRDKRSLVLLAILPMFVAIYVFNPFFLEHYAIILTPTMAFAVLLGGRAIADTFPRFHRQLLSAFVATILAAGITSLWEVNQLVATPGTEISDETFRSPYLRFVNQQLPDYVRAPAVVLFTYHPGANVFEEPVYNFDVAWPDDAAIIRAHNLGPEKNRAIFEYFAKTQPARTFWIMDATRPNNELEKLGTAEELTRKAGR